MTLENRNLNREVITPKRDGTGGEVIRSLKQQALEEAGGAVGSGVADDSAAGTIGSAIPDPGKVRTEVGESTTPR